MKAVFFYVLKVCIVLTTGVMALPVKAQQNDTVAQQIGDRIDARKFTFKALTAIPQTGGIIQLTTPYDIKIGADSIISYLPYFGRAFVAPMNPQDAGLQFTATDFTYEVEKENKDEWSVTIKTNGLRDNYKLFFTIYNNRQAQLQVSSNNRQSIRFDGEIIGKPAK